MPSRLRPSSLLLFLLLAAGGGSGGYGARSQPAAAARRPNTLPHPALPSAMGKPTPPLTRVSTFRLVARPLAATRLAGGEIHVYELVLPAGHYLHAIFDQRGIDLYVDVYAPDRTRLLHVDSPTATHGAEQVRLVTAVAGRYRLEVSAPRGTAAGSYLPRLLAVRPAAAADRTWADADMAFYEARELDRHGAGFWQTVATYESALLFYAEVGDRWHQGYCYFRLGRLHHDQARAGQALTFLARASRLFDALGDRHFRSAAQDEIGRCYFQLAAFPAARRSYRRALALARGARDRREEAAILHNLGELDQVQGHAWEALHDFGAALALWERETDQQARAFAAETLTGLGWVYASLGEWERAADAHARALHLRNRLGDPRLRAISLTQLGAVYLTSGANPGRALAYELAAWELVRGTADSHAQAVTLNELGLAYRQLGRYRDARATYLAALKLEAHDGAARSIIWSNLGWAAVHQKQPAEALPPLERALRLAREAHASEAEAHAMFGMAAAERERGNLMLAQARAEAALDVVESLRATALRSDLKTSYLAANDTLYALLVRILMERHHQEPGSGYELRAFERSEQARSRALLDALVESRMLQADTHGGETSRLRARRDRLLAALAERDTQRGRPGASAGELGAGERTLVETLDRLREIDLELRRRIHPDVASAVSPFSSTHELSRRLLPADTVMLEYFLDSPRSWLWALSADALQSCELPGHDVLDPLIRSTYQWLEADPSHAVEPGGRERALALSRLLLGPVATRLRGKRLLIAANDALQSIPLAALPDPEHPGEPLALRHEIVYVPSLSVLAELRARGAQRRPAPPRVALLSDPVFDRSDERLPVQPGPSSAPDQEPFLPRLRGSRREALAISSLLPPGRVLAVSGFCATRELVTGGALSSYSILHFATHGLLRTDHPELSSLVLSRFDRRANALDGYLRASDIVHLALPADLVVLSACRTALGRETPGEGMVGLPQAFFTAGAQRVLVSLWPVEEESTTALMKEFYRRLLGGHLPAARALREAQLAVRAEPRWSSPRYWAGFVLQGDWQ